MELIPGNSRGGVGREMGREGGHDLSVTSVSSRVSLLLRNSGRQCGTGLRVVPIEDMGTAFWGHESLQARVVAFRESRLWCSQVTSAGEKGTEAAWVVLPSSNSGWDKPSKAGVPQPAGKRHWPRAEP